MQGGASYSTVLSGGGHPISNLLSCGREGIGVGSAVFVMRLVLWRRSGGDLIWDGLVSPGDRRVISDGSSREPLIVRRLTPPNLVHGALCCPHVPAPGKIVWGGFRDQLADDVGFRRAKLFDELLKHGF